MLQITETAASVFRDILAKEDVQGTAIRLAPEIQEDGRGGISLQAIDRPAPSDAPAQARGVHVVVAAELAESLEDAILDARQTETGAELFLVAQPPAS